MDSIEIIPRDRIDADISLPGSKSITNRALVIGALAEGRTTLTNWLESEDTTIMIQCLLALGFGVECAGKTLAVTGRGGEIPAGEATLNALNSGTTMRFLAGLAALGHGRYVLDGNERMRQRPIEPLLEALRGLGIRARSLRDNGCPPVEIVGDGIAGGECEVAGDLSSQFLSSLLLCAPGARSDVTIRIRGDLVSKPYVTMTLEMMEEFGVPVERKGWRSFQIPAGRKYRGRNYPVEGDASSASYFWAAAAITGGRLKVTNVGKKSIQGDARFVEALGRMGVKIRRGQTWIEVSGPGRRAIEVDLNDMPDMVPTLAVMALFVPGKTVIKNVANLRHKESDRLQALATELGKIGAKVKELKDGLMVERGKLRGAEIETYRDHRIAMAFSLAGLKVPGIKIKDPGCVSKTFPGFFELFNKI